MSDEKDNTHNDEEIQPSILDQLEDLTAAMPAAPVVTMSHFPPREYDVKKVNDFLDVVFPNELEADENILMWTANPKGSPSYPKSEDKTLDFLEHSTVAKSLYFGTSVFTPDPDTGKLHNRQDLFSALHVVVLDDIGTKVAVDKIPTDFPPTYILETSAGNFQYGYVLDEPIKNFPAAEALIQLVYESGCSDEGGKMPNKLVRLPEGVNGKEGNDGFITTIISMDGPYYSPQDILDKLDLNTSWEEILKDAAEVLKRRATGLVGTTPWASTAPVAASLNGFIDPVLEWLYETDQVTNDNGTEWLDILCPWHEEHTGTQQHESTARYSPIGRGSKIDMRGFKCFHEHCSGNATKEFLLYVAGASGIEAGIKDAAAALCVRYVFDAGANGVWDVTGSRHDVFYGIQGFNGKHPHTVTVYTVDGKAKQIPISTIWRHSPSRVDVAGATYDPSTTARITVKGGDKYVNLFTLPAWGQGPIRMEHVDRFNAYLEYLLPKDDERAYFLMWLAAKMQNVAFRGAAIVMVAHRQGIGRSTLSDMVRVLLGQSNHGEVSLTDMVGGSPFNEWQEKPFVVSEETRAGDAKEFFSTYEKLKTIIDPRAKEITINPKYGKKREATTCGSYLFLSNHENAIAIPEEDRRFYVIQNATEPASPKYFMDLNEWLDEPDSDGLPAWARSVFRWLQTVEVDMEFLLAPPPKTAAKITMSVVSQGDKDFAVNELIKIWPSAYINANDVFDVLHRPQIAGRIDFQNEAGEKKFIRKIINGNSLPYEDIQLKVSGRMVRPRLLVRDSVKGAGFDFVSLTADDLREKLAEAYKNRTLDLEFLADALVDCMDGAGR